MNDFSLQFGFIQPFRLPTRLRYVVYYDNIIFVLLQIWCVVVITAQRYTASRDPFRANLNNNRLLLTSFRRTDRRISSSLGIIYCSTYRKHFRLPIILSISAIVVNMPAFFELMREQCVRYVVDVDQHYRTYQLAVSFLRHNYYYKLYYKVIFRMIMQSCGPNIVILCKC